MYIIIINDPKTFQIIRNDTFRLIITKKRNSVSVVIVCMDNFFGLF